MGCGKGEIVKLLQAKGFDYVTLSSMVRTEAKQRGIEETRENLMMVGNGMRKIGGAGILAKKALQMIKDSANQNWVVDGIRNPVEILELRKQKDTLIVAIEVDKNLLVKRILSRARANDPVSKEEVLKKIDRELGLNEPEDGQQVAKCIKMADIVVSNNGTLEEFKNSFLRSVKV